MSDVRASVGVTRNEEAIELGARQAVEKVFRCSERRRQSGLLVARHKLVCGWDLLAEYTPESAEFRCSMRATGAVLFAHQLV